MRREIPNQLHIINIYNVFIPSDRKYKYLCCRFDITIMKQVIMKKNRKQLIQVIFALLAMVTLSSCNRGTGCPSSFDIQPMLNLFGF